MDITTLVKQCARLAPPRTITIATPDLPGCAAVMKITYRGMVASRGGETLPGVSQEVYSTYADTYHILDEAHTPQEWEQLISIAGWEIGAGYMFRWHHAPGSPMHHLFGSERYYIGDEPLATGDAAPDLAEVARQYGAWQWEINCGWNHPQIARWRAEDPTRTEDGTRALPFPGWDATHPWMRATEPLTGYESRYYYCRPERYNSQRDAMVMSRQDMTIDQASGISRVSRRGLRAACERGYIPGARKIGRDWLIPPDGLQYYIQNRPKRGRKKSA